MKPCLMISDVFPTILVCSSPLLLARFFLSYLFSHTRGRRRTSRLLVRHWNFQNLNCIVWHVFVTSLARPLRNHPSLVSFSKIVLGSFSKPLALLIISLQRLIVIWTIHERSERAVVEVEQRTKFRIFSEIRIRSSKNTTSTIFPRFFRSRTKICIF